MMGSPKDLDSEHYYNPFQQKASILLMSAMICLAALPPEQSVPSLKSILPLLQGQYTMSLSLPMGRDVATRSPLSRLKYSLFCTIGRKSPLKYMPDTLWKSD